VPRTGVERHVLWRRYCRALQIDPAWAPAESHRENASMGAAEATLIRRLNVRLEDSDLLDSTEYRRLVKQRIVHDSLAHRPNKGPVTLPPGAFDWAEEVAEEWISYVRDSGIDVVGDLDDLRPLRPSRDLPWVDPDQPPPAEMLDAALQVIEVLLVEAAAKSRPVAQQPTSAARLIRRLQRWRGPRQPR
jgi:hypothetical protein